MESIVEERYSIEQRGTEQRNSRIRGEGQRKGDGRRWAKFLRTLQHKHPWRFLCMSPSREKRGRVLSS
jgi:hypothetical protein